MDIARVRAVITQMSLKEKIAFLGSGLSMRTKAIERLKIVGLRLSEDLLFYRPTLSALGCTFDRELVREFGILNSKVAEAAKEAAGGVVNLGVVRDPMKKGSEAMFSEDPLVVSELAGEYITGAGTAIGINLLSGEGVFCDRVMDKRAQKEIYQKPFDMLSKRLDAAVIPSGCLNDEVVSNSRDFVLSTKESLPALAVLFNEPGSIVNKVDAVNFGASYEIGQSSLGAKEIAKAVENGRLDEKRIDQCLERVLMFVAERYMNLKELAKEKRIKPRFDFDERASQESIVLLKNDGTLPLAPNTKISLNGDITKEEFSALGRNYPVSFHGKDESVTVIFAKEEGGKLAKSSEKLLNAASDAGKKIILVILSPRPIETNVFMTADAVCFVPHMYFSTFSSLIRLLYGEFCPSGKLNVSWAFKAQDYPANKNFKAKERGFFCYESVYNGYRYFNSFDAGTQFPFGHGLSYTKFEYSKLQTKADEDGIEVEFVVKNIGNFDSDSVAFVFCDLEDSPVYGLKSRLGAFARFSLDKSENTAVKIKIPFKSLTVYNEEKDEHCVPGGMYQIKICDSATNVILQDKIKVPHPSRINTGIEKKKIPGYYVEKDFNPLNTEIELVLKKPLSLEDSINKNYVAPPPNNKVQKLEKALAKKISKSMKRKSSFDFTGLSQYGFDRLMDSE